MRFAEFLKDFRQRARQQAAEAALAAVTKGSAGFRQAGNSNSTQAKVSGTKPETAPAERAAVFGRRASTSAP